MDQRFTWIAATVVALTTIAACGSTSTPPTTSVAAVNPTASPSNSASTVPPTPSATATPVPSATPTPSATATPSSTPYPPIVACTSAQLGVTADTRPAWSDGVQAAIYLVVTNVSPTLCSVTGYPLVAAYDAGGLAISVTYEQGSFGAMPIADPRPYRTPLIEGENAYAGMTWDTGTGPNCAAAGWFQVTLPAPDPSSIKVSFPTSICMTGAQPSSTGAHRRQSGRVIHGE